MEDDRGHPTEAILVHELAHAVMDIGLLDNPLRVHSCLPPCGRWLAWGWLGLALSPVAIQIVVCPCKGWLRVHALRP